MILKDYHSVYFIGIGGIGMSALARWFNKHEYFVAGYDRTSTTLTEALEQEGIAIHYDDEVSHIPQQIIDNKRTTLVVYTPAVPKKHSELNYLLNEGFTLRKRSEVLGLITADFFTVAVAGTHGKTTTASMIAHLFKNAGRDVLAFMGGITTNYNSNFILNDHVGKETIAVVEADEFDRSFLTLNPDIAVITSSDADHLDIYGSKENLQDSFKEFIGKVREGGSLFIHDQIANELAGWRKGRTCTYGLNQGQFFASNITMKDGFFEFDYTDERHRIERLMLGVPGFHNVENATVAIAIGLKLGLDPLEIKRGIESYRGVKRRFEYILKTDKVIFVDDYAHHPSEIEAFLTSMKALYPGRRLTAIFQPHLFTRTRDFADDFAKSLSIADDVLLLDIYPAREEPIAGVTSEIIYDRITAKKKTLCKKDAVIERLRERDLEVLATIGAGDIGEMVDPIKEFLKNSYDA